jgi:hypothetical protein
MAETRPLCLVELRCKARGCGKLLDEVVSAPASGDELRWASYVRVHLCPRHGGGGGHGSVAKWVEARRRLGRPHDRVPVGRYICWAELRSAVQQARLTGRTQVHVL